MHKFGDEILVSEVRNGWARISEEDDEYPFIGIPFIGAAVGAACAVEFRGRGSVAL